VSAVVKVPFEEIKVMLNVVLPVKDEKGQAVS
jgi:hypothetical protein